MATILKNTLTRTNTLTPWLIFTPSNYLDYFTQPEIDNIILPAQIAITNLAGYIGETREFIDLNSRTIALEFDSRINAEAALTTFLDNTSIIYARKQLFSQKTNSLGMIYRSELFLSDI